MIVPANWILERTGQLENYLTHLAKMIGSNFEIFMKSVALVITKNNPKKSLQYYRQQLEKRLIDSKNRNIPATDGTFLAIQALEHLVQSPHVYLVDIFAKGQQNREEIEKKLKTFVPIASANLQFEWNKSLNKFEKHLSMIATDYLEQVKHIVSLENKVAEINDITVDTKNALEKLTRIITNNKMDLSKKEKAIADGENFVATLEKDIQKKELKIKTIKDKMAAINASTNRVLIGKVEFARKADPKIEKTKTIRIKGSRRYPGGGHKFHKKHITYQVIAQGYGVKILEFKFNFPVFPDKPNQDERVTLVGNTQTHKGYSQKIRYPLGYDVNFSVNIRTEARYKPENQEKLKALQSELKNLLSDKNKLQVEKSNITKDIQEKRNALAEAKNQTAISQNHTKVTELENRIKILEQQKQEMIKNIQDAKLRLEEKNSFYEGIAKIIDMLNLKNPTLLEFIKVFKSNGMKKEVRFEKSAIEPAAANKIVQGVISSGLQIPGLKYQPIPGDGNCLFSAVGLYFGGDPKFLRNVIAVNIEHNLDTYRDIIEAINPGRTVGQYLQALRNGTEWADNLEISILMKLLDRPIVIIGSDGKIRNLTDLKGEGDPIFVYYNGHNHYDGLILTGEKTGREIFKTIGNMPKVIATPAPKVVATPAPKVVAAPAPKVVAAPSPKVVAAPAPKVIATPAPKVVAPAPKADPKAVPKADPKAVPKAAPKVVTTPHQKSR